MAAVFFEPRFGLVVALATLSCGCNSNKAVPAPSPAESGAQVIATEGKVYTLGEVAKARDYSMSVEAAAPCAVPPPFAPRAGYEKLGVTVVIDGTSERQVPANPFYAMLTDVAGTSYASTLAGCKPPLTAHIVTRGEKARGMITFEIPVSASKLVMTYAPAIIAGGRQELRFDLGQ